MVLSYDHWAPHEVAQVASVLKERYGPGFVGKALHEIQSNGHKSDLMHVMLVSAKEPASSQTWAESAREFLMGYGKYLYDQFAQLLESMDAVGAVVRAKIVPEFLGKLYKRAGELMTATGKKLKRAAAFVMENAKSLWKFIRDAIFGVDGLTEEEADLLEQASEQTNYLRTAASAVAGWLARWFYGIGRGIAKICSAAMGIMKQVVTALMGVTGTVFKRVLELPIRLSEATARFHRRAVYAINFTGSAIIELMSSWTENKKRYAEKYKKFLKSVNDALERALRFLRKLGETSRGRVLVGAIMDIPEVDAILRFMGMLVVRDPTGILLMLYSGINYVITLGKKMIDSPLAFAQSYILGLLPLIAQTGARLFAKSAFGDASADYSLQGLDPLVKAADEWGSLKGDVEAEARRRCRNAAAAARNFIDLCHAHKTTVNDQLEGRSASQLYRDAHLSADLLTQAYFDEDIDEDKLNQLSQNRYGLDHADFIEAVVTLRVNLSVQINAAVANMRKVEARKRDAGVEYVGYEALGSVTSTKDFVDTLRANTVHTEGWFSWLPWKVPPSTTLAEEYRKLFPNASADAFESVQGVRQAVRLVEDELQQLRSIADQNFAELEQLSPSTRAVTAKEVQFAYGTSIAEIEDLSTALRKTLNKIRAGSIVLTQAKNQVLELKTKKSQLQAALLGGVILVTFIAVFFWVNAYTPRQLADETQAAQKFLDIPINSKESKRDQVLYRYYEQWQRETGKLISNETDFYDFVKYVRLQALHLERADVELFSKAASSTGRWFWQKDPTTILDQPLEGMFNETTAGSRSYLSPIPSDELRSLFKSATEKIGIASGIPEFASYDTPVADGDSWITRLPKNTMYYKKGGYAGTINIFYPDGRLAESGKNIPMEKVREMGMYLRIQQLTSLLKERCDDMERRAEKSFSALKKVSRFSVFWNWMGSATKGALGIAQWSDLSFATFLEKFKEATNSILAGGMYWKIILAGFAGVASLTAGIFLTILMTILLVITVVSNYLLGDWEDEGWDEIPTLKLPMKIYFEYVKDLSFMWAKIVASITSLVKVISDYQFSTVNIVLSVVSVAFGGWALMGVKKVFTVFKELKQIKMGTATAETVAEETARIEGVANEQALLAIALTRRLNSIQRMRPQFALGQTGKKKKKQRQPLPATTFGGGASSARF